MSFLMSTCAMWTPPQTTPAPSPTSMSASSGSRDQISRSPVPVETVALPVANADEPDAAPAPSSVGQEPTPGAEPTQCVDPPGVEEIAHEQWIAAVDKRVDAALPQLAECSRRVAAGNEVSVTVELEYARSGRPSSQRVRSSTAADCQIVDCVKRLLGKVHAPVWQAKMDPGESIVIESILLKAGAVPRRAAAARSDETPRQNRGSTCSDQPAPGRLAPEEIQKVVRSHYEALRTCYEAALARDPKAEGRVEMRFVIGPDGATKSVRVQSSTLTDCGAVRCMREHYQRMHFPSPQGGPVTVVYPIMFAPG